MIYIKNIYIFVLLSSCFVYSQYERKGEKLENGMVKQSYLDSLKSTFTIDHISNCIDEKSFKELTNQDLSQEIIYDLKNLNIDEPVEYELPTQLLKERLQLLNQKSPFNIEYNTGLENTIKSFLKNRKRSFARLMGISKFYFPLFEEALSKYNIPLEIKYLAIVESALNTKAVSRVGATGLWQFMYQTGLEFDLKINSFVDERRDPIKSSDAAARYMSKMHQIFGDWELVLASYNSGAGNVSKAIRRSNGHQNFWNIKKQLPRETQSYVPLFLATMYIFEYHKEHGIVPENAVANYFKTDTIAVKKEISFKQISDLLDMPVEQIEFFNPSYKLQVIPFEKGYTHYLCLPKDKIGMFTSNEQKIYAYVDYLESQRDKPKEIQNLYVSQDKTIYHKVRKGDNLASIANKYQVEVADIKKWNGLKSNTISKGRSIKIIHKDSANVAEKPIPIKEQIVNNTLKEKSLIASETISKENLLSYYTVKEGETLESIARLNNLKVEELKKINCLDNIHRLTIGQKLELVKSNCNDENFIHYKVQKGESIYFIAKKHNVTIANIKEWNSLDSNDIKLDQILMIDKSHNNSKDQIIKDANAKKMNIYIVKNGDSLFSISKKHNITIALLKKKNDIKEDVLKPGMKLIL